MKLHSKHGQVASPLVQAVSQLIPHTQKLYRVPWELHNDTQQLSVEAIISTDNGSRIEVIDTNEHTYISTSRLPQEDWLLNKQVLIREPDPWYQQEPQYIVSQAGEKIGVARIHNQFLQTHIHLPYFSRENATLFPYQLLPDIFK